MHLVAYFLSRMRGCRNDDEPLVIVTVLALLCCAVFSTRDPEFLEPARNITVIRGRDAELPCVVNHLGKFQVAWVKVDTQTILTIHKSVVTRNYRITLKHGEHRNWYLHIKQASEEDRGLYMCQVNTEPMRSQRIFLNVTVSPNIIDDETSSDLIVNEGVNVTLSCRATGYPPPIITWKREDSQMIALSGSKKVLSYRGDDLFIHRVSRLHMGAYLCIASNDVPPAVSKRIVLKVHFGPMISIPNQLIGRMRDADVMLECDTEAFPKSINYWTNEKGEMVTSGDKYTTILESSNYKVTMKLQIQNLEPHDFGSYKCLAKNSLGDTDGTIRLYEIPRPTPKYVTTTDKLNFESKGYLGEYRIRAEDKYESELFEGEILASKGRKLNSSLYQPEIETVIDVNHRPKAETSNSINTGFQFVTSPRLFCLVQMVLAVIL